MLSLYIAYSSVRTLRMLTMLLVDVTVVFDKSAMAEWNGGRAEYFIGETIKANGHCCCCSSHGGGRQQQGALLTKFAWRWRTRE